MYNVYQRYAENELCISLICLLFYKYELSCHRQELDDIMYGHLCSPYTIQYQWKSFFIPEGVCNKQVAIWLK